MALYEIGQCSACPLRDVDPLPLTGNESCEPLAQEMCRMLIPENETLSESPGHAVNRTD